MMTVRKQYLGGRVYVLLSFLMLFLLTSVMQGRKTANAFQPIGLSPIFEEPIFSLELTNINSMLPIPNSLGNDFPTTNPDGYSFDAQLSANGDFVVARQDDVDPQALDKGQISYVGTNLHVWTLQEYTPSDEGVVVLLPTTSRNIGFGNDWGRTEIAISPNGQYVATQLQDAIAVYKLPELNLVTTIAAPPSLIQTVDSSLVWSPDSRFIASIRQHQLLVWEAQTQQTYTYEFAFEQMGWRNGYGPNLTATSAGWLLDLFSQPAITFLACDWQLSNCQSYGDASSNYIVNSNEPSPLLSASDLNNPPISTHTWQMQNDGTYVRSVIPLTVPSDFIPVSLSPSGEYLFFRNDTLSQIWRTSNQTIIQTLSPNDHPIWFPDENYFLTYTNFTTVDLYRTGQTTPYASQDFLEQLSSEQLNRIDLTVASWTIDSHGTYALFQGGWTNLLVPIKYNEV